MTKVYTGVEVVMPPKAIYDLDYIIRTSAKKKAAFCRNRNILQKEKSRK
jgi:hypothetical protein